MKKWHVSVVVLFFVMVVVGHLHAMTTDTDGDGLIDTYDPFPTNIDGDGDGVFDPLDFDDDISNDGVGNNLIASDLDNDDVHDDADADDVYPSAPPPNVATVVIGGTSTYATFGDYVNVAAKTSVTTELSNIFYAGQNSGAYVAPTSTELERFDEIINLMEERDFISVIALADDMNADGNTTGGDDYDFELVHFLPAVISNPVKYDVYCLQEITGRAAGGGIYCINYAAEHNHHVSVSHSTFDTGTDEQGGNLFWEGEMRYFSMATANRCATHYFLRVMAAHQFVARLEIFDSPTWHM